MNTPRPTLGCFPLSARTSSVEETERLGAALGQALLDHPLLPAFVAMYGDLGVGKTAFVRGLASILAPERAVRSPTFALVHEYRTPARRPLFHFDLYRIESEDDLYSIGYDDYVDAGICVCEWCEKIPASIPPDRIEVCIRKDLTETGGEEIRCVEISLVHNDQKEGLTLPC